jgi:hypothetical protein
MIHVIKTLTGVNISTQTYRIDEEPEHKQFKVQPALFNSCESLSDFYRLPRDVSRNIYNCYMTLWGRSSQDKVVGASLEQRAVLLEENFKRNIKDIIG